MGMVDITNASNLIKNISFVQFLYYLFVVLHVCLFKHPSLYRRVQPIL